MKGIKLILLGLIFIFSSFTNIEVQRVSQDKVFKEKIIKIQSFLKQIESNNKTQTIGDGGRAYGILQIHKVCVDDVNKRCGTEYTHQDAFNESCAEEIFYLYLKVGRDIYLDKYKEEPSRQDLIRMWNGGIYSGYKKESTVKYYKKYLKLLKKKI